MVKSLRLLIALMALTIVALLTAACAPAAATPTATPKPVAAAPTPTKAGPTPTPQLIKWVGGKLQPLPDGFPNKPITLLSGFAAGSTADIYLRAMAEAAKDLSPVPLTVEDRSTGARLYWAMIEVMESQPGGTEGYWVGEASYPAVPIRQFTTDIGKGRSYKDINPIILNDLHNFVIAVRTDAPWKTFEEVVQYAKANPGKLNYSSYVVGSQIDLAFQYLAKQVGFTFYQIPHTETIASILTLLGGGSEITIGSPVDIKPHVDAGKLKALLQIGETRLPGFPDVRTDREIGQKVPLGSKRGIWTHSKVPKERVEWLFELFKAASDKPAYKENYSAKVGAGTPIMRPEEVRKLLDDVATLVEPMIREAGLHIDQQKK